jgi:hypothetical protein
MVETKTVADLNPRSQAVKGIEMAIIRCLGLIEAFEELDKNQDWTDVEMSRYRKILGNGHYQERNVIAECYNRFRRGTLYGEVLDMYENLPPAVQQRKEVRDGIKRVRSAINR